MSRRLCHLSLAAGLVAALALPVPAHAADPGLTVLSFLKLGAGARAASLGEAYVAVSDDAASTYWNPAGLLQIEHNDILGAHNEWIQDLRHEFVAFGARRGKHAVGLSFMGLYTDDIQSRDETGQITGSFGFSNSAFSGSYAFQAADRVGLGATVRYARESIIGAPEGDNTLSGFAFDFGGTWDTPMDGLRAAVAVRNLGGQFSYDFEGAQSFDLPTTIQAGVAFRRADARGGGLTLSGDVISARGDDTSLRVGAEYAYRGQFLLGAGYKTGLDNENVSFGVGYDNNIRVNYAFTPVYSDLGNSHRIALGYGW